MGNVASSSSSLSSSLSTMVDSLLKKVDKLSQQQPRETQAMVAGTAAAVSSTAALMILAFKKRSQIHTMFFHHIPMYILTEHRSVVVTIFGLPLSLVWDGMMKIRAQYIHTFYSAPHLHDERVRTIQKQVHDRPDQTAPLCTARPGWQSVSLSYRPYKKQWNAIEMPLYDILDIDTTNDTMIVHVEPFVSIGQLTHELNPMGYTLPVVPEMDDLTIGGLINGTGIESSSHKYGLFHEIVTELELLLGDGTVVIATSDNEYSDLFHAIPWSYGTLALLLSAKLKLIPCKNYVKLTYTPHHDKESYIEHNRTLSGEYNNDDSKAKTTTPMFIETLAFSLNTAVVMSGDFVDIKDIPKGSIKNHIGRWYKPWFYKHVETMLWKKKKNDNNNNKTHEPNTEPIVEYIPLRDYYHRHTQSLFWEMELMIPIGNHVLFRWFLGWLMPPKVSFLKLSQTEMTRQLVEQTHVAQDFLIPTRNWSIFMDVCDVQFDHIYPVWLCLHDHGPMPGSLVKDPKQPRKNDDHEMYIDIGVYGLPRCVHEKHEDEFDMKSSMITVLDELVQMDGFQMLYADVFYTKKQFETMFDHEDYRKLRIKYKANDGAFKEVYDKMSVIL